MMPLTLIYIAIVTSESWTENFIPQIETINEIDSLRTHGAEQFNVVWIQE